MPHLTLLGVGAMSSRLAVSLASAGNDLTVWNRTTARASALADDHGWRVTASLAEAVANADVVLAVLADDDASRAVWAEALPAIPLGALCLDSSTLSPARAAEFVDEVTASGRRAAVTPMVGSLPQADAGALTFLAGGPAAADATEVLTPACAGVRVIGSAHDTAVAKLVINAALATQTAMMAELSALCDATLADSGHTWDAILDLPVFSATAKGMLGRMRTESYNPNFTVSLMRKDLGYALGAARAAGLTLPVGESVEGTYLRAEASGLSELDLSAIRRLF